MTLRRSPFRMVAFLFALVALGVAAACDAPTETDGDVTGTWRVVGGDLDFYFVITEDTITTYDGERSPECYGVQVYEIVSRDGDSFVIRVVLTAETDTVTIRRDGNDLLFGDPDGAGLRLTPSSVDVSTFEICTGAGADPAIQCTSLSPLVIGTPVDGVLNSFDELHQGFYFDLYALQLDASATVQIDLEAENFDAYLYVFDAAGTLIGENDDGGTGFNARISLQLDAGCYRVEATSWRAGVVGSYTLTAS